MSFSWLNNFHRDLNKGSNYAEKTLAAYRLGIRSGGSIVGVRLDLSDCCRPLAESVVEEAIFHPDDAPHLPLEGCRLGEQCQSVYRPVMAYEVSEEEAVALKAEAKTREDARKEARRQSRRAKKPGDNAATADGS